MYGSVTKVVVRVSLLVSFVFLLASAALWSNWCLTFVNDHLGYLHLDSVMFSCPVFFWISSSVTIYHIRFSSPLACGLVGEWMWIWGTGQSGPSCGRPVPLHCHHPYGRFEWPETGCCHPFLNCQWTLYSPFHLWCWGVLLMNLYSCWSPRTSHLMYCFQIVGLTADGAVSRANPSMSTMNMFNTTTETRLPICALWTYLYNTPSN